MRRIAHRGNIIGPNSEMENRPNYIDEAIMMGFDCEIDLWMEQGDLFLGHDSGTYQIEPHFLFDRKDYLWVHCKNFAALDWATKTHGLINAFWHDSDTYAVTTKHNIWTIKGNTTGDTTVWVDNSKTALMDLPSSLYGICGDYIGMVREEVKRFPG